MQQHGKNWRKNPKSSYIFFFVCYYIFFFFSISDDTWCQCIHDKYVYIYIIVLKTKNLINRSISSINIFQNLDLVFDEENFVLCLEDRLAEKFIGECELEKYGLIIIPGDGRPRKSGWYNDDSHK